MDLGNIPGYYYDKDKKKYFKVQDAAVRSPGEVHVNGKKRDAVKQHRQRKKQRKAEKKQRQRQLSSIQRNRILQSFGHGTLLSRELGHASIRSTYSASSYNFVRSLELSRPYVPLPPTAVEAESVGVFAYDPLTKGLFVSKVDHYATHSVTSFKPRFERSRHAIYYDRGVPIWMDGRQGAEISAIEVTSARHLVTAAKGTGIVRVVPLLQPEAVIDEELIDDGGIEFHTSQTIWACAPKSVSLGASTFMENAVAFGTDEGVLLEVSTQPGWQDGILVSQPSAVLSLNWTTPSVLAIGRRDRSLVLYDLRADGGIVRFRHPSSIVGIRSANEHQLILAGLKNRMAKYDVRMPGRGPIFVFPGYSNPHYTQHGFDVCAELGLVAAGHGAAVQTWDMYNGREIKTFQLGPGKTHNVDDITEPVRCLRFVEDNGATSIMASQEDGIYQLRC